MILLLKLGDIFGMATTLMIVIGTGLLGAYFVKREGFRVWTNIQGELKRGKVPQDQLIDALLLFVAGIILITPGILTDLTGFVLLIPTSRDFVKKYTKSKLLPTVTQTGTKESAESTPFEVID